jgi:SAM-dependent methyltransferase
MARELINILVKNIHDHQLEKYASQYLNGRLIDIGCGEKPYAKILSSHIKEHVGVDHEASIHSKSKVDLFGTAYQIPIEDCTFDSAICTAVLEHLEEPELALRECHRVLKPGGVAIYSVPFIWHLHEQPRDFYRFSKYGLEYLFNKVDFEIIEIHALSGFWVTFGQLLVYNLYRLNCRLIRWLYIVNVIGLFIQAIAYVMDRIDKAEEWTWMYMIVVRKK